MDTAFDKPQYRRITEARLAWLDRHFPAIAARTPLASAIEYGCGAGVFTRSLSDRGLSVLGLDLRLENIQEARRRHPYAQFRVFDFDGCAEAGFAALPMADLGFATGILYHLENPIGALRRMCGRTRQVLIIETRTAEGSANVCTLYEEPISATANARRVVIVPTLSAVVTCLHFNGFPHVYRPADQPDHPQWADDAGNGRRHCLIAYSSEHEHPGWANVPHAPLAKKWEGQASSAPV